MSGARVRLVAGALLCALAGCTGGEGDAAAPSSTPAVPLPPADVGPATTTAGGDCAAPSTPVVGEPFRLPATGGRVTGLLFADLPVIVGSEVKIVWRVTGDGDLAVRSVRPDGSTGPLTFGPEAHTGSNFSAPGGEWGTGFRFDAPGCWVIEVRRGPVNARLAVDVRA
jgi:hypothetical protein